MLLTSAIWHAMQCANRWPCKEDDQLHEEHEAGLEKTVIGLHVSQPDEVFSRHYHAPSTETKIIIKQPPKDL